MLFWLRPEFTRALNFKILSNPSAGRLRGQRVRGKMRSCSAAHGLKMRTGGDDFANTVMALTSEFPEATVFIAGHTHQAIPSRLTNGVLLTQADHFGIHVGGRSSVRPQFQKNCSIGKPICELMDNRFHSDHVIVSRAKSQLTESDAVLSSPVANWPRRCGVESRPGLPAMSRDSLARAIGEALVERNVPVDGVMHGAFDDRTSLVAGPKTLNDIWNLIPYENYIVTAQLSPEEVKTVMEEVFTSHEKRNLLGFEVKTQGRADDCRIVSMTLANGRPLIETRNYIIAFNSFDSRSGGHHFMTLRLLLERLRPIASCIGANARTR